MGLVHESLPAAAWHPGRAQIVDTYSNRPVPTWEGEWLYVQDEEKVYVSTGTATLNDWTSLDSSVGGGIVRVDVVANRGTPDFVGQILYETDTNRLFVGTDLSTWTDTYAGFVHIRNEGNTVSSLFVREIIFPDEAVVEADSRTYRIEPQKVPPAVFGVPSTLTEDSVIPDGWSALANGSIEVPDGMSLTVDGTLYVIDFDSLL